MRYIYPLYLCVVSLNVSAFYIHNVMPSLPPPFDHSSPSFVPGAHTCFHVFESARNRHLNYIDTQLNIIFLVAVVCGAYPAVPTLSEDYNNNYNYLAIVIISFTVPLLARPVRPTNDILFVKFFFVFKILILYMLTVYGVKCMYILK